MVTIDTSAIDEQTREGIARLVDLLLPGTADLPTGRVVGAHLDLLDRVLAANPRLSGAIIEFGRRAMTANTAIHLDDLEKWSPERAEHVVFALNAAYFISPAVRAALGYPGQERRPINEATPDEIASDELIAPVRARGSIFARVDETEADSS